MPKEQAVIGDRCSATVLKGVRQPDGSVKVVGKDGKETIFEGRRKRKEDCNEVRG